MAHEKPKHTSGEVNRAGHDILVGSVKDPRWLTALGIVNNWRSAHSYPLNAFHLTLRNRSTAIDPEAVTGQRLKRLVSVIQKLRRNPRMRLPQMQDIGGSRSVVSDIAFLDELRGRYITKPLRHTLTHSKDYLADPKEDGYRGIHLMYRYRGKGSSLPWNSLRIELQLRSKLQHSWATAVETVDIFTAQKLKFGGGNERWRRFFALAGAAHAMIEGTSPVPGTPNNRVELRDELAIFAAELNVRELLASCTVTTEMLRKTSSDYWYVLLTDPVQHSVTVRSFKKSEAKQAAASLEQLEQEHQGADLQPVLVSATTLEMLELAYPNYFADTFYFSSVLDDFLR